MNPVLRLCTLFLAASLCAIPAGWLLLVCVELAGFDSSLLPRSGWTMFAAFGALAVTLPPALHAWPDDERPLAEILREVLRAALISFALSAVAFLAGMRPLARFLALPDIMMAPAAAMFAPLVASLLACLSATVCRALLPRPGPEEDAPPSMRRFGWVSLAALVLLLLHPWIIGVHTSLFPGRLLYPAFLCAIVALRHSLIGHGSAGMIPAWSGVCLLLAFRVGTLLPEADGTALAYCAALLLLIVASCFCLLHRESRRWLC